MTTVMPSSAPTRDIHLWIIAVGVSLGVNVAGFTGLAFLSMMDLIFFVPEEEVATEETRVIEIMPIVKAQPEEVKSNQPKQFVRTSADQPSGIEDSARFMGEHDTLATSDATPDADAPELPSQTGVDPPTEDSIETTKSNYQDGSLDSTDPATAVVTPTTDPAIPAQEESKPTDATEESIKEEVGEPAPIEQLAESPLQVDIPVEHRDNVEEQPKEPLETAKRDPKPDTEKVEETPKTSTTSASTQAGFTGYQKKTEIKGSISRQGRSALDVKSGPLGKYYAELSRAIEQSWQREVTKRRDFIVPGVLRIRVVLDENGYVRTVSTVEEAGVGKIQVGFTHLAIRNANIPKMPDDVKKQLDGEPLELLYNFIF